jgi:hypothetical protein
MRKLKKTTYATTLIFTAPGPAKSFGSLQLRLRNSENSAPHFIKDGISVAGVLFWYKIIFPFNHPGLHCLRSVSVKILIVGNQNRQVGFNPKIACWMWGSLGGCLPRKKTQTLSRNTINLSLFLVPPPHVLSCSVYILTVHRCGSGWPCF